MMLFKTKPEALIGEDRSDQIGWLIIALQSKMGMVLTKIARSSKREPLKSVIWISDAIKEPSAIEGR